MRIIPILCFIIGVINIVFLVRQPQPVSDLAVAIPAVLITIGIVVLILPRYVARRGIASSKILQEELSGEVTSERVTIQSAHGQANLTWDLFHGSVVRPDLVMLYLSAYQYHLFVPSFFRSEQDWNDFRELVQNNVRPRPTVSWSKVAALWAVIVVCVYLLWTLAQH